MDGRSDYLLGFYPRNFIPFNLLHTLYLFSCVKVLFHSFPFLCLISILVTPSTPNLLDENFSIGRR